MPSRHGDSSVSDLRGLIGALTQQDPREAQFDARLQLVLAALVRRLEELEARVDALERVQ